MARLIHPLGLGVHDADVRVGRDLPLVESAVGSLKQPEGGLGRLPRRARFVPRTAQIGLRGVTRRQRRSGS